MKSANTKNKIQIDNLQIFMLLIGTVVGFGHFIYIHLSYIAAGRDAWVSLIIGFLIGTGVLLIQFRLVRIHPGKSLVQITLKRFGKSAGTVISCLYTVFFCLVAAITAREVTNFLTLIYPATPPQVFLFAEFGLAAWIVRSGLEVVARTAQILLPVLALLGLTAALTTIPDKDPSMLLPILDRNIGAIAQGTAIYVAMFADLVVFGMFLHEGRNPGKLKKHGIRTIGILFIMFIGPVTGPIMIFGETLARALSYPTYTEIQYIQLSGIIERLDVLGIILWTLGSFIRISVFAFGATKAVSEILGDKDVTDCALPVILFIAGITVSMMPMSRGELHHFLLTTYPIISISIGYMIPAITVMFTFFQKTKSRMVPSTSQ